MYKLKRFLKNYRKELVLGPFFKLLEAIFELIVPIVMSKIIDNGIKNGDSAYVLKMCGVMVILGICGLCFALTCQYLAAKCAYGFGTELRNALYSHINSLSHAEIDRFGTSSLTTRLINDTNQAQQGVNMFIRLAVRVPFLIIGAAVMAMLLDLKLAVVFFIAAPVISAIIFLVMKKTIPMYKTIQKNLDGISLLTRENLEGVRVIRAFSKQNEEKAEFHRASQTLSENAVSAGKISAVLNPVTFTVMNLGIVAILWFGGIRVDSGSLTQGEITAFVNYMTQILLALVVLANLVVIFTKAASSCSRINEVFDASPSVRPGSSESFCKEAPAVEFENVCFTYPGAGDASLRNISFTLEKGETLGIIGGTGSGKSTLAGLIPRFYDAGSGSIKIFGNDIKSYDTMKLRKMTGIVPQKASLFSGTIADNLRWGKPDADEEEMIQALKTAQAWEFVSKLPDGLETQISQDGKNLSGGQRQRLTIARAFTGNPPIIILDDSMSALDYSTDLALRKAIADKLSGSAVIMISQRATTLQNADKILVLDDGEPAGFGTHEKLLETSEVYRDIYNTQMS
ncbi:MAG: ABC transporter ATP-binding protein [Porcipelethomonas sp.]